MALLIGGNKKYVQEMQAAISHDCGEENKCLHFKKHRSVAIGDVLDR